MLDELLLFSHFFKHGVRGHTKVLEPINRNIRKTMKKTKFGWEARRFPPKKHPRRRHTRGMKSMYKLNQHGRGCPLNYSTEHIPVPTTNQLVATNYSGCCLEWCLHRTKRTVVVNTERNMLAVWGDDSRAYSEKRAVKQKTPSKY